MSISPTMVYIVEDDLDFGAGLDRLFRGSGYHTQSFNAGRSFLDAHSKLRPGCLFVDLAMPGMSGLDLLRKLRAAGCDWPVVILSGHGSAESAEEAMRAGALAFLEKPPREIEVLAMVRRAQAYLGAAPQMMYDEEVAQRIQHLSRREREVFDGMLQGLLNKQIAAQLGVSESTIKSARRALLARMQAETSLELIALALRGGVTVKTRT
jgi:FixJ family two-component response regulator